MANQLSPAQRAQNFSQLTRKYQQMLPPIAGAENGEISLKLPNVRLGSRVKLLVTATINAIHASNTTFTLKPFAPYTFVKKVLMDFNTGFAPYTLSGRQLFMMNMLHLNGNMMLNQGASGRGPTVLGNTAAPTTGANNTLKMILDLPIMLNERDPVGLVILQNNEVNVNITIDFDTALTSLLQTTTGYTVAASNIVVTPMIETFSIPTDPNAIPDISVLKLTTAKIDTSIPSSGPGTMKLNTGTTYRRMVIYFEDTSGNGYADSAFGGNFSLVFNQADTPLVINPTLLAAANAVKYGTALPAGMFVLDFTDQGIPNYGGTRDLVDTSKVTEYWFNYTSPGSGTLTVVSEVLSQLQAS